MSNSTLVAWGRVGELEEENLKRVRREFTLVSGHKLEPHSLVLPASDDRVEPREQKPKPLVHAHRCMGVCPQLVEAWFGHDELLSCWDAVTQDATFARCFLHVARLVQEKW